MEVAVWVDEDAVTVMCQRLKREAEQKVRRGGRTALDGASRVTIN